MTIHGELKRPAMGQNVAGWIVSDFSVFPTSSRSSTLFLGRLTLRTKAKRRRLSSNTASHSSNTASHSRNTASHSRNTASHSTRPESSAPLWKPQHGVTFHKTWIFSNTAMKTSTRRHIPQDLNLQQHRYENLNTASHSTRPESSATPLWKPQHGVTFHKTWIFSNTAMKTSTRRHIAQDLNLQQHRYENLKSRKQQTHLHIDPPFSSTQNSARCLQADQDITSHGGLLRFRRPCTVCTTAESCILSRNEVSCSLLISGRALCHQPYYHTCSCERPATAVKILLHRCHRIILALAWIPPTWWQSEQFLQLQLYVTQTTAFSI